ncbi:hypothetical protein F4776DRAFT_618201 [Hypoxylon sp. NC0597]|nr:hypothetical protein F4776DRAFT_618201 [Hypoxylon sp. NC0597]
MESSCLAVDLLCRPYLILQHERLKHYYNQYSAKHNVAEWAQSRLNPQNRIDSLDISTSRWRADGSTASGTQFFIVPLDLLPDLEPLRIDVFISDQLQHPPNLRADLDLNLGVSIQENRTLAKLGISRHLCRALDQHCIRDPSFLARYRRLPFGSRLFFTSVRPNPRDMELLVIPTFDLEGAALSVESLQKLWDDIPREQWPEAVDLSRLRFVRQLHESITLVQLADERSEGIQQFVLKSNTDDLTHLYHELRFLLQCPPHPNIMPRPVGLVTKRSNFGGKVGVFGFLLPYFPWGSIRDVLPRSVSGDLLPMSQRLSFCIEVTSALIHIKERCGTFYSDLRPDNVLLSSTGHAIICDFEQRGNHYEWCPPETLPYLYLENLKSPDGEAKLCSLENWTHIIKTLLDTEQPPRRHRYLNIEGLSSINRPWLRLDPLQQEKAMVYTLGLFIYAVFEGLSGICRSVSRSYPTEPNLEFPQMRFTPIQVQTIIHRCTNDAPEWGMNQQLRKKPSSYVYGLLRHGGYIVPAHGQLMQGDSTEATIKNTVNTALRWWYDELSWADDVLGKLESGDNSFGYDRPGLAEVLTALQEINM